MNLLRKLPLVLLLSAFPALAAHVAVLETMAAKDVLKLEEKQYITDVLRSEAVKALPAEMNFTIMTRDNIQTMLPPGKSIEDCEGSCLVETGKNISADYIAQGRVGRFGNSLTITVELYETAGNKLMGSFTAKSNDIEQLEVEIRKMAKSLFVKARGNTGTTFTSGISAGANSVSVKIQTVPMGASVAIDGRPSKCSSTPCTVNIAEGEHRILVAADDYKDKDTVMFFEGKEVAVKMQLDPNFGQLNIAPRYDENRGGSDKLSIQIDERTTINDKPIKKGIINLLAGMHKVNIEHPCYEAVSLDVGITVGKTETFNQELSPAKGWLSLKAELDGAEQNVPVWADGKQVGQTPFQGEVPLCSRIEVGENEFRNDVNVELRKDENVEVVHQLVKDDTRNKFVVAEKELTEDAAEMQPVAEEPPAEEKPAEEPQQDGFKRIWGGLFVGATYNDFWDTEFGFGNLKSGDDYSLKVEGADGLLGNYWGVGVNAGIGALFLVSPFFGVNVDVAFAFRQGKGRSDVIVKLFWNDESRSPEMADLEIEYSEMQMNIDVPVLLRLMVPNVLYVEAGPLASFNLYSLHKSTIKGDSGPDAFREEGGLNVFEFDAAIGIGTMRSLPRGMLDFNLRFVLGITPLSDADDSPKTWQGQLNIGYWFL